MDSVKPDNRPAEVGKGLRHKTMSAAVAEELRRRILSGVFAGGFALRQDALADEFGTSRIPIREALMQLEAEGLVKIEPHRGAVVLRLSLEEIGELFELRALVEPALLKRSAPNLTREDYHRLHSFNEKYSEQIRSQNAGQCAEINTSFHLTLYCRANRPRTMALATKLLQDCDRHTRMQLAHDRSLDRAEIEHTEIVRLCEAGKFAEAARVMKAHIENAAKTLRGSLSGYRWST